MPQAISRGPRLPVSQPVPIRLLLEWRLDPITPEYGRLRSAITQRLNAHNLLGVLDHGAQMDCRLALIRKAFGDVDAFAL